jgi:hypothetical protein
MHPQLRKKRSIVGSVGLGLAELPAFPKHLAQNARLAAQSGSESSFGAFNSDDNNFRLQRFKAADSCSSAQATSTSALSTFDSSHASTPPTSVELEYGSSSSGSDCEGAVQASPTLQRRKMRQDLSKLGKGSPVKARGRADLKGRKVLKPREQEHYWSMQEMLAARGVTDARVVTPGSTLHRQAPEVKHIKSKPSLADLKHKLFSFWGTQEKPALTIDVVAGELCERPQNSPRSCSSATSDESIGDSVVESTCERVDEEVEVSGWLEEDETVVFAQCVAFAVLCA